MVGFIHRDDCPVNRRIPWYLIFGGAAGIISVVLRLIMILAWSCSPRGVPEEHPALAMVSTAPGFWGHSNLPNLPVKEYVWHFWPPLKQPIELQVRAVNYLFRLFVIAWNLAATFHIYSVVPNVEIRESANYCDETTYILAYTLVILFDVLAAIIIIIWVSALVAGNFLKAIFSPNSNVTSVSMYNYNQRRHSH